LFARQPDALWGVGWNICNFTGMQSKNQSQAANTRALASADNRPGSPPARNVAMPPAAGI